MQIDYGRPTGKRGERVKLAAIRVAVSFVSGWVATFAVCALCMLWCDGFPYEVLHWDKVLVAVAVFGTGTGVLFTCVWLAVLWVELYGTGKHRYPD